MPWRSGSPHGVLGAVHSSAPAVFPVNPAGSQVSRPRAIRIEAPTSTIARTPSEIRSRRLIGLPPVTITYRLPATDYQLDGRLLRKSSVHELFDERLTLEFHQLDIALHPAIQRE